MASIEDQRGMDALVVLVHGRSVDKVRRAIERDARTLVDVAEHTELRSNSVLHFGQEILAARNGTASQSLEALTAQL